LEVRVVVTFCHRRWGGVARNKPESERSAQEAFFKEQEDSALEAVSTTKMHYRIVCTQQKLFVLNLWQLPIPHTDGSGILDFGRAVD